ncbi:T-cell antigen CD7 [Acomys russatus]|uniref:T-cell antigen CD7 n=1 Tax=Acomys russatus TaxID=60746 RepID=UPI0021E241B9|nr:T-cell antigen CD7 [Acomys russatus]
MTQQALLALLLTLARVLPGPLDAQEVQPSPPVVVASEGESINITCSTSLDLEGIYLKQTWPRAFDVIYFEDGEEPTVDKHFWGRIAFSGSQRNLTITMRLLQLDDAGVYTCWAVTRVPVCSSFTTVVVKEKLIQEAYRSSQGPRLTSVSLPVALAAGFFLAGLVLGAVCVLRKSQIKKLCASRDKDSRCVVYEDMSCNYRKATCTSNTYQ